MCSGLWKLVLTAATSCAATVALAATAARETRQDPKDQAPAKGEVVVEEVEKAATEEQPAAAVQVFDTVVAVEAPMAANDEDGNPIDPELLQYVQQLRPIVRAELHRIRLVTKADDAQIKAIAGESRKAVIAAAKAIVKQMRGGMNMQNAPDPVTTIGKELESSSQKHLTEAQQALYAAERKKQDARQRRSAARLLVAALDEDLGLSSEQREKVLKSVEEKWRDDWIRVLAVAQYGRQYYPPLSDEVVSPHLNDRQKSLWKAQKRNHQQIFGFFWHSNFDNSELEPDVGNEVVQQGAVRGVMMIREAAVAVDEAMDEDEEKKVEEEQVEEKKDKP